MLTACQKPHTFSNREWYVLSTRQRLLCIWMLFKSSILLKPKAINSTWSFSFKFQAYQGFRSIWAAVIVCNLPFLLGGRGIEPPNKFSKRGGGLDRTSTFRGVCWERGGYFFFRGIPIFEIFNINIQTGKFQLRIELSLVPVVN